MKKALAIDVGGTCLDLFALNVSTDFASKNFVLFAKVLRTLLIGRCLGFAPRSESFAIEPSVQVCSISSLSGLTSCRPSANPLNPKKCSRPYHTFIKNNWGIKPHYFIWCRRRDLCRIIASHFAVTHLHFAFAKLSFVRFVLLRVRLTLFAVTLRKILWTRIKRIKAHTKTLKEDKKNLVLF